MFSECEKCHKKNIFLGGSTICNNCIALFHERLKNKQCTECGASKNVHYSGLCGECHKARTDSEPVSTTKDMFQNVSVEQDKKVETSSKQDYDRLFLLVFTTALGTVLFLRALGVFDSNFKSEGEVRIDLYSECIRMNGIECEKMLEM